MIRKSRPPGDPDAHAALSRLIDRYEAAREVHAASRGDHRREASSVLDAISRELWILLRGLGRPAFGPDGEVDLARPVACRAHERGQWNYIAGPEPHELWRLKRTPRHRDGRGYISIHALLNLGVKHDRRLDS